MPSEVSVEIQFPEDVTFYGGLGGSQGSVHTSDIVDASITTAKLADDAVTADKLGTDSVYAAAIQDGAVGTDALGAGSVTAAKLAADSIEIAALTPDTLTALSGGIAAWELGHISAEGVDSSSTTRIRTPHMMLFESGTVVRMWCDEGYKFGYYVYDEDGTFVKSAYWCGNVSDGFYGSRGLVLEEGQRLRILLARIDGAAMSLSEGTAMHMQSWPQDYTDMCHGVWSVGAISASGGESALASTTYCCKSSGWYTFPRDMTITIDVASDAYAGRAYTYDSTGTFVSRTGYLGAGASSVSVLAGYRYRFAVRRTDSTSTLLPPEEADTAMHVSAWAADTVWTERDDRLFAQLRHLAGSGSPRCVSFLHFSDIHGDGTSLTRILALKTAHMDGVSDVLCSGDMLSYQWSNDFTYWDTAGAGGVLTCIGNHDRIVDRDHWDNTDYYESMANAYTRYYAPYIADWGVTYTEGKTYWYKDYDGPTIDNTTYPGVRLIALDLVTDGLVADTEQLAWFTATLADAKTQGLAVVVMEHFPCVSRQALSGVGAWFDADYTTSIYSYWFVRAAWQDEVQTFIDGGGEFVCWLTGHMHADMVSHNPSYPAQTFVTIDTATPGKAYLYSDTNRTTAATAVLFNVVAVDTVHKRLRVMRVGASENYSLDSKKTLCIDYTTATVLNAG